MLLEGFGLKQVGEQGVWEDSGSTLNPEPYALDVEILGHAENFLGVDVEISQKYGYLFGGTYNKHYSVLGSPFISKLPCIAWCRRIFLAEMMWDFLGFSET